MDFHPFQAVSQVEWRLYFSMAFLESSDAFGGSYDLAPFATPGTEGPTNDYVELLYRVTRYLWHNHGYRLGSLDVGPGGSITTAGPICDGNAAYVVMLRQGQLPDLSLCFRAAIALAEEEIPGLSTEPSRAALAQVERDRQAMARRRAEAPEVGRERERLRDAALGELGIVRIGEKVN